MSRSRVVVLGAAAVALTGGVVYAAWNYMRGRRERYSCEEPEEKEHGDRPCGGEPQVKQRKQSDRPCDQQQQQQQQQQSRPCDQQQHASQSQECKGAHEPGKGSREPPCQEKHPHGKQILVLGLDGAGKSSILYSLATNKVKHCTTPTEGFNAVCVTTEETKVEFLEIGGSESLRSYWNKYLGKAKVLVFVVDSADHKRLPVAKDCLHDLMQNHSSLPVMVLANKQDLDGACSISEIHEALGLSDLGDDRKMFLIGTFVASDDGEIPSSIHDAKELISQLALDCET